MNSILQWYRMKKINCGREKSIKRKMLCSLIQCLGEKAILSHQGCLISMQVNAEGNGHDCVGPFLHRSKNELKTFLFLYQSYLAFSFRLYRVETLGFFCQSFIIHMLSPQKPRQDDSHPSESVLPAEPAEEGHDVTAHRRCQERCCSYQGSHRRLQRVPLCVSNLNLHTIYIVFRVLV